MTAIQRLMVAGELPPVSHYCHVVRAGNQIWVSGALGIEPDGTVSPDVARQAECALASIDTCLLAAGAAGAEHVVKVNVYLTDINDRAAIDPARQRYFGEHRPASTLVGVAALVLPAAKVEIEAIAIVPEGIGAHKPEGFWTGMPDAAVAEVPGSVKASEPASAGAGVLEGAGTDVPKGAGANVPKGAGADVPEGADPSPSSLALARGPDRHGAETGPLARPRDNESGESRSIRRLASEGAGASVSDGTG